MKKLLITGSTGFFGKNLISHFSEMEDWEVVTVDINKNGEPDYIYDLEQKSSFYKLLKKVKPDYIINAAGITKAEDAQKYFRINLLPVINLLETIVEYKLLNTRILLISSSAIYGNQSAQTITEDITPAPINNYGYSKFSMEIVAEKFIKQENLNLVIARPFNVIGEEQDEDFVIPAFIQKLIRFKNMRLDEISTGDLSGYRDFIDIDDVASAFKIMLEKGKTGECYNVGSGKLTQIREVLHNISKCLNITRDLKINEQQNKSNVISFLKSDCTKLYKLGWKQEIDFEESLKKMIRFQLNKLEN